MSHVNSRHYVKMQVYWPLVMVVSQRCKVWQRHAAHTKMELSVSSATNKCQRSQLYNIQSVTVLDEVALENTKSLSSNMVIMFACIVHDLVSSCAPFASSFNVCKKLHIGNFPSLQGSHKLHSSIHTVRCRSMYVLVSLWISLCHATYHLHFTQHKLV